jgi:hypothetical protein
MKAFYEKPDEEIVQNHANQHKKKISEKLNTSMQVGTGKDNMTIQHKTCREADEKGYNERCNMGL